MLITAFDIEYDFSAKKITSYGYWRSDGSHGGINGATLMKVLDKSDVIMGHNILHHDLPVLKRHHAYTPACERALDTLYLS